MLRGGAGIAFNLLTRKRPRPLSAADGATLSDSAHEVVSEDGFSRLAPPSAHSFTVFSSFLFLFRPRGEGEREQIVFTALPTFRLSQDQKEGQKEARQLRWRIEPRHNYLVLAMELKRCCRLYPLKDIHLFARAQGGERTAAPDRKCNVERIRFRRKEGRKGHNCSVQSGIL